MVNLERQFLSGRVIRKGFCPAEFLGVRTMTSKRLVASEAYLVADIATASRSRLSEILYDGIIEMCTQAVMALDDGMITRADDRIEKALSALDRAHPIVEDSGHHETERIIGLINQINAELLEALQYNKRQSLIQAISLLHENRTLWKDFAKKLTYEKQKESWIA